ncbi:MULTISPECIES: alpha/beta hydrolase [unclassified Mycobacterium]|uniref:alpha/beta hydrolase n=1 Tax=unclassified Mycobacterium TaxID=2642494 RepID=UPI00096F3A34|nr:MULTISPECIES: alpha/beta hydrolase [unclassified Mycobacterium]OMC21236.1 alpha/beta hydrolase [Mycobacterium sp. SP-6446]OMC54608.1 alpha/beta hydrolase [Mycobacterium sp. IS-836]
MLETIDKGSCTDAHPVPLLFVHGGWHGAWCWDDGFLDFFADAGYRAVAMSLRGHGTSPTAKPLQHVSIADYIDDVRSVADDLGGAPVLIGHSLGGYTIQRYLEDRNAPAAVLVGSLPPQGVLGAALRVWRRRPWMTVHSFHDPTLVKFLRTQALAREYLFCADTPDAVVESCWKRAGPESIRAAMTDPMLRRVDTARVTTPILVLGGLHDGFVSVRAVRATARAYRTEPEFFDMGHNMMLEPGWPDVAARIDEWLRTRDLAGHAV